ncbi:hypothetical protein [Micromonospora sp. DT48]
MCGGALAGGALCGVSPGCPVTAVAGTGGTTGAGGTATDRA